MKTKYASAQECLVLLKLLLGVLSLLICGLALFEHETLNARMVRGGGLFAVLSVLSLAAFAALALADTVVNDMLPERWRFRWAKGRRHLLWGCTAATYAGYAFVLGRMGTGPWLAAIFLVYACGCLGTAFLDLRFRAHSASVGAES